MKEEMSVEEVICQLERKIIVFENAASTLRLSAKAARKVLDRCAIQPATAPGLLSTPANTLIEKSVKSKTLKPQATQPRKTIKDYTLEYISKYPGIVRSSELYKEMRRHGYVSNSAFPVNTVYAFLNRAPFLKKVGRGAFVSRSLCHTSPASQPKAKPVPVAKVVKETWKQRVGAKIVEILIKTKKPVHIKEIEKQVLGYQGIDHTNVGNVMVSLSRDRNSGVIKVKRGTYLFGNMSSFIEDQAANYYLDLGGKPFTAKEFSRKLHRRGFRCGSKRPTDLIYRSLRNSTIFQMVNGKFILSL